MIITDTESRYKVKKADRQNACLLFILSKNSGIIKGAPFDVQSGFGGMYAETDCSEGANTLKDLPPENRRF